MELTDRNLGRLLRMELPELVFRGRQETFKFVDRIRLSRAPATRLDIGRERLNRFRENCETYFFEGPFDPLVPEAIRSGNGDECQAVLVAAHHASRGRFDLLGYRALEFGDPPDWHLDPVSGRRAPFVHWSLVDPLDSRTLGDSKVIWELNRHQWLVHLAQAWRLTGDHRYAQTVVYSIQAWLRLNPPGIGINWASSLEVAFRLISWCWALILIRDSGLLTPDVFLDLERAAEAHATHVERYLSHYFSPNTHLTGEALGLFYAGVVFRHLKRAERWRSLASRILVREIEHQVLPDGVYFERSTCYQRYTADIYLHFLILAGRSGIEVPAIVAKRLKSMLDVLLQLRQPDGSMPSIGDADDGAVMPLSTASPDDYRATFSTAAVMLRDSGFAWAAGRLASDTLWLLGTRAAAVFQGLEKREPDAALCRVFPAGGFVAMRSGWDAKAHGLIFDAGPLGCEYSAGHGHADLLSIQCSAFGERYLVDAGTSCYTANREVRNFFRSTTAHSTVVVDGMSQAEPAGPFSWVNRCSAHLLRWSIDPAFSHFDAFSDAYKRLADSVTHRRRVAFVGSRYWIVIDDLCASENHRLDIRFQFAPMQIRATDDGWVRASRSGGRGLLLRSFASTPLEVSVREGVRAPMEGWVSSGYGHMEPAPAVVYTATTKFPVRILTLLWPAEDVDVLPDIEVAYDDDGRPFGLHDPEQSVFIDADDEFVIQQRS
ncbi:MAG TPA: alginate lyase family protein [Thermoanaerobaculia bacterium]|jgi:hypothetical protein